MGGQTQALSGGSRTKEPRKLGIWRNSKGKRLRDIAFATDQKDLKQEGDETTSSYLWGTKRSLLWEWRGSFRAQPAKNDY